MAFSYPQKGIEMKEHKIKVTISNLNGSVSYEIRQGGAVIAKDTFCGKSVVGFNKEYQVDSTTGLSAVITHHEGVLPEVSVTVIN